MSFHRTSAPTVDMTSPPESRSPLQIPYARRPPRLAPVGVAVRGDRGVALVVVLLATSFLSLVASSLALLSGGETLVAGHYRDARRADAAAAAALELAASELRRLNDWNLALSGAVRGGFTDSTMTPRLHDGTAIDLTALAEDVRRQAGAGSWGADEPQWTLFVFGPLGTLLPPGELPSTLYIAAWIADDTADGDGNPTTDANGIVQVWAEARGPGGLRRVMRGTYARTQPAPSPLTRLAWRHGS